MEKSQEPTEYLGECDLSTIEPLEEYFSQEFGPNGTCRPCQVEPLASLYLGVLEEAKASEAARKLSEAYETGDISTIAKTMDIIKGDASPGIREELQRLDCFTQSFVAEDEEEASPEAV
jgi:hypothetical protein